MTIPHTADLFDFSRSLLGDALQQTNYPWEILPRLKELILALGKQLPADEYDCPAEGVWIHKTAKVAPTASIGAPCIICAEAEVRHCAFIRGSALVGRGAVVGNSTELKNALLFDGVQVPHYNYVGDSVLGYRAHMGAGAVTSNVKGDRQPVVVHRGSERMETGLKKLGAMLGDYAEIGCGAVLNPGAVIGRGAQVYPLVSVRGTVPANCIHKGGSVVEKR